MQDLTRYDTACRALSEARTIDEVKDILNKAEAIKEYARRAKNRELEVNAVEIRYKAERRYGELLIEMKANGEIAEGRRPKTVGADSTVSRKTLSELEIDRHFSSHCQRVAIMPISEFDNMLKAWRTRALTEASDGVLDFFKAQQKQERRNARERELGQRICKLPQKKYGLIYADPEWRFEVWSRETGLDRSADNHYPTSPLVDIETRDVLSIAADVCGLGLWSTVPMLSAAIRVMEDHWGFCYKTHWCWAKDRIGPGYWNRNKHELFLFGTRGDLPCPAPGQQWDSLLEAPRRGHSEKPDIFLEMMESYFPHLPKIELNRRGPPRKGWDAWGNEVEDADQRKERRRVPALS